MIEHGYAWEKFYAAVKTMASGTGSIHQRLADAYCHSLIRLNEKDIPASLLKDYSESVGVLKKNVLGGFLSDDITEDDASDIADKIVEIHEQLSQAQGAEFAEEDKPKITRSIKARGYPGRDYPH